MQILLNQKTIVNNLITNAKAKSKGKSKIKMKRNQKPKRKRKRNLQRKRNETKNDTDTIRSHLAQSSVAISGDVPAPLTAICLVQFARNGLEASIELLGWRGTDTLLRDAHCPAMHIFKLL